ncbi:hypothetical protein [Marinivivus vitaminiproducens]|uniref:hypothetical protein n=1 Tax=Marinivivus vitaminiproducens TaxID=3035935 RepID=UPI0027A94AA4|nr:hypothetical protein P4R82_13905 [Geminicoccaceae bacterium SCSIO 64248]
MTLDDFLDRLDRLGPELAAWPIAERVAANELLQRDPEARRQKRHAERVERTLHGSGPAQPDADLRRRIEAIARNVPQEPASATVVPLPARAPRHRAWAMATAASLAASVLLGFVVGLSEPAVEVMADDDPMFSTLLLGPDDSDEALPWL